MGLHTGLVVIDQWGDSVPLASMAGDTIALATQLAQEVALGTIVLSETTARLVRGTVRLEALGRQRVTGVASAFAVYRVHSASPQRSPMARHEAQTLAPFVGRARELAMLHELLAQAEQGHGQVVGIVGEPGMGKSRLLYEFRRSLQGRQVTYLTGQCVSYGSTTPYLPILAMLRQSYGCTDTDPPEVVRAGAAQSPRGGHGVGRLDAVPLPAPGSPG
jgi:hypothetical protein